MAGGFPEDIIETGKVVDSKTGEIRMKMILAIAILTGALPAFGGELENCPPRHPASCGSDPAPNPTPIVRTTSRFPRSKAYYTISY
jgi:hypothetical protein